MGLLDIFGGGDSSDPSQANRQGLLAMGLGLLSSHGNFSNALGQAGLQGMQTAQAYRTNDLDAQYKRQQIAEAQQNQQLRDLSMQRVRQQLAFGGQLLDATTAPQAPSAASAALGQGAAMGSVGPTPQNAALMAQQPGSQQPFSRFASLSADQIAGLLTSGVITKDDAALWRELNTGVSMQPGYRIIPGQRTPQYLGDPTKGVTLDGSGAVVPMTGAGATLGAIAGATKAGEMKGTNSQTPIPLDRIDRGLPLGVTPFSSLDALLNPPQPTPALGAFPPAQQQAMVNDAVAAGRSPTSITVNGGMPAFKTPADLAGEKVTAENTANLATKPQLDQATTAATKLSEADQAYADSLNNRVNEGWNLKRRNAEILKQIDDLQTGIGGSETRTALASNIKNLLPGNPTAEAIAAKIQGGSTVSAQTMHNLVAGAMITSAINVLQGQGRLNKAEVQQFQKAAESPETDPGALRRIIAIQDRFADQDFQEQQARAQAIRGGTYNPATWQADFAAQKWGGANKPGSVFSPATSAPKPTLRYNPATGKLETAQ